VLWVVGGSSCPPEGGLAPSARVWDIGGIKGGLGGINGGLGGIPPSLLVRGVRCLGEAGALTLADADADADAIPPRASPTG
jgi:hypothetical protein